MRAVFAFKQTTNSYHNLLDILVGRLALIKNHQLKLINVLYTTKKEISFLKKNRLWQYYDEIHFIQDCRLKQINWNIFGAAMKFFALEEESKRKNNEFFLQDCDLVLMSSEAVRKLQQPYVFGYKEEKINEYNNNLKLPENGKYPSYGNGNYIPITTAIIKIKNINVIQQYLELAFSFILNNRNTDPSNMITVEQRFLANIIYSQNIQPTFLLNHSYCSDFDTDHFHIGGIKHILQEANYFKYRGLKALVLLFKQTDLQEYNIIIKDSNLDMLYLGQNGDQIPIAPQFKKYHLE